MPPRKGAEIVSADEPERDQPPAIITPAQMLSIAVQQGADLAKLEKLMDLQQRWDAEQARKAYNAAIASFRADCPTIERKQKGHNDRLYAGLADTLDEINGLLAAHELSHSWRTRQDAGIIYVTCTVTHSAGHSESTELNAAPDTSGNKNAIQAVGSTVQYLQRYTLYAVLGLASRNPHDDDGKASGPEQLAAEQLKRDEDFEKKLKFANVQHTAALLTYYNVVMAIKAAISEELTGLPAEERSVPIEDAASSWHDLGEDAMRALWLAPSKGGCFTTRELGFMKDNFRKLAHGETA